MDTQRLECPNYLKPATSPQIGSTGGGGGGGGKWAIHVIQQGWQKAFGRGAGAQVARSEGWADLQDLLQSVQRTVCTAAMGGRLLANDVRQAATGY